MKKFLVILMFLLLVTPAVAEEDGYDYEEGSSVEFDDSDRSGGNADFFDYGDGKEHDASIEKVDEGMGETEVYDYDENEYRTIDTD